MSEQIEQQSCQKGKLEPGPSKTSPFLKWDEFMVLSQKKQTSLCQCSGYFTWQMNYQWCRTVKCVVKSQQKGSQASNYLPPLLTTVYYMRTILYFNMKIMRTCTRAIISCMEGFCFKFHTEKRISLFCSVCNGACQVSVHFLVPFLFLLRSQFMHCAAVPFGCTTYCSHPW